MISLLLATRNGTGTLPDVLDGLVRARTPVDGFEIIAVDNASDDGTGDLLRGYAARLPIRVLDEPRPGKNVALNRALADASGDLLVFTDDDVLLPEDFLVAYAELARCEPRYALFGGHIVARWQSAPDERILEEVPLVHAYTITETDRERGPIKAGRLFGPNMAIRRDVFDGGLRFDERIGPNGGHYVMGDETDLLQRAEAAGFAAYFEPNIVVEHRITDEQIGSSWLARRAALAGRTMAHSALRRRSSPPDVARLFGFPRWAVRDYIAAEMRAVPHRLRPRRPGLHAAAWERNFLRGYLVESRRLFGEKGGSSSSVPPLS